MSVQRSFNAQKVKTHMGRGDEPERHRHNWSECRCRDAAGTSARLWCLARAAVSTVSGVVAATVVSVPNHKAQWDKVDMQMGATLAVTHFSRKSCSVRARSCFVARSVARCPPRHDVQLREASTTLLQSDLLNAAAPHVDPHERVRPPSCNTLVQLTAIVTLVHCK